MLNNYLEKFAKLKIDTANARPEETLKGAPHKPFLWLAIADMFAQGGILKNQIELRDELIDLFNEYWSLVMQFDTRGNIALPFFHMRNEELHGTRFWQLVAFPEHQDFVKNTRQIRSVKRLQETVSHAVLDDRLFELFCVQDSRDMLRTVLIETYFAPAIQQILAEQAIINVEAFHYSKSLLERRRLKVVKEQSSEYEVHPPKVRDQGFRKAIQKAYEHRCALCGIRMRTPEGHTVVDAAHIIPWSVSRNDDPTNGMALCRLCHWSFDEGLVTVSTNYDVVTSKHLNSQGNIPGHIIAMSGRPMVGPKEEELWPAKDALEWHKRKVFNRG